MVRAADYWKSEVGSQKSEVFGRELKVVVGYDRRFFSERFAQTSADALAGNGFQMIPTPEPTPTPSVSFAVKHLRAGRRRDDYRQPQSADFQRLQTQIVLRRLQQPRGMPGRRMYYPMLQAKKAFLHVL